MTFTPFTDNIIFYDTEFSSLDPYVGEILSIGAVKMNGEEFYCELEFDGEYSDWIKENLLHTLTASKVSREEAREQLTQFVGPDQPYMMAYVNDFDVVFTRKFMNTGETSFDFLPFYWLPLDFASILFAHGFDPEIFMKDDYSALAKELNVSTPQNHSHNALNDAKFLREIYLALIHRTWNYEKRD